MDPAHAFWTPDISGYSEKWQRGREIPLGYHHSGCPGRLDLVFTAAREKKLIYLMTD